MENIMECAYMIPYIGGEIKCFKNKCKKCSLKCNSKLPLFKLKEVYPNISDIPVELLNLYVNDCIFQEVGCDCHNLFLIISMYFESLDPKCKYYGTAYRYTSKKKDKPKIGDFYNFSTFIGGYNGGSGMTKNQKTNHLWKVNVEGVIIEEFINIYCPLKFGKIFKKRVGDYIKDLKYLAKKESTLIGKPISEPIHLNRENI